MQSGYGIPEISEQQQLMADDCSSSVFSFSKSHSHHLHYSSHLQQQQQLHPMIITHQLFHHPLHLQPQSQPQQWRETLCGGGDGAPYPFIPVNFKLGLNESSCGRDGGVLNQEEVAAIKEPFWKRHNTEMNNRRCNEDGGEKRGDEKTKHCTSSQLVVIDDEREKISETKYRLFGELEAVCNHAAIGETNKKGSGCAPTGANSKANACSHIPTPSANSHHSNLLTAATAPIGADHRSETSIGKGSSLRKLTQKRKRRNVVKDDELASVVAFFESLVKQLMDHQEALHRKFIEAIEKMEQERIGKEEAWRLQELAKFNEEAVARAHLQALASSKEAAIFSYLEKITGQTITLPTANNTLHVQPVAANCRWPKAEVEALIQARSGLESKFRPKSPGLMRGNIWEEISTIMSSMGYERSAKRCKEKWENINKYFRIRTKDNGKKRPGHSKICPYFDQLFELYSS